MPYNNNAGVWGVVMENAKYRELLKGLNTKEKKIAKLYFGIGESAKLSAGEIAEKLSYSYGYVDFVIENLEDKLDVLHFYNTPKDGAKKSKKTSNKSKKMDAFYMVEKVDEATSKLIDKMSDTFFKMFPNEEPLVVEHSLKLLPKKDRNIVFLYYGLDGIHCLDYDEIAEKYRMSIDSVDKSLETSIRTLKRNFSEGKVVSARTEWKENKYTNLVRLYGEKKVNEVMILFSERKQAMVKEYYLNEGKTTAKEIGEKYSLSTSAAYTTIIDTMEKAEIFLKENAASKSEEMFFERFQERNKERIIAAFNLLDDQKRTIVRMYYGIGMDAVDIKDIAKKYYVTSEKIIDIIEESIRKTNKKISLLNNADSGIFYKKFKGYSKNQIDKVLDSLSKEEQELINFYYGLMGTKMTINQISENYGYSSSVITSLVNKIRSNIKKMLDNPGVVLNVKMPPKRKQAVGSDSEDKIVEIYKKLVADYGEEKFIEALEIMNKESRRVLKSYLGIKEDKKQLSSIAFSRGISESKLSENILSDLDKISKFLCNRENNSGKRDSNKYYDLVSVYGLEQVEKAFNFLKQENQEIIKLYCGLGDEKMSQVAIAKKYGTSGANISARINRSFEKIEEFIKNPPTIKPKEEKAEKESKYVQWVNKYGQTKVDEEINKLSDTNQKILKMYYGINCKKCTSKEIAKELNSNEKAVYARISSVSKRLVESIENPKEKTNKKRIVKKKNDKYDILVETYGESKVTEALIKLGDKHQKCIMMYYGINTSQLTQKEIAEKLNISINYVSVCVAKGIQKMTEWLEHPELTEDIKDKFYSKFEGYSKSQVDEARKILIERDSNIINDYYLCEKPLSISDICEKYGISHGGFYAITSKCIKHITRELEEPGKTKVTKRGKGFYENFNGYSKEDVDAAMEKLSVENKEIISLLYGLDGRKLTAKQISEEKGFNAAYIYNKVGKQIQLIKELLINPSVLEVPKKKKEKKEKPITKSKHNEILLREYVTSGNDSAYDELIDNNMESVIKSVNHFINSREIKETYEELLTIGTIGLIKAIKSFDKESIEKKSFLTVASAYINNELSHHLNKKEEPVVFFDDEIEEDNRKIKVQDTLIDDTFEDTILEEHYNQYKSKKVNQVLQSLNEQERKVIELYYGLNRNKKCSQAEIAKVLGVSPVTVSRLLKDAHNDLLFALKEFKDDYPKNEEKEKIIREREEKEALSKKMKEAFFSLFKEKNREEVVSLLNSLPVKKKKIIVLYYGLQDGVCLDYDQIAEKYNIPVEEVINIIEENVNQLRGVSSKEGTRDSSFKNLTKKYNDSTVKEALNELSESEKAFLVMYYTLGDVKAYTLSDISKKIGVDESKITLLEKKILEKFEKTLIIKTAIKQKKKEFISLIIDKKEMKKALKSLEERALMIVSLYYGLNGRDLLSKKEICEKFKIKENDFDKLIKDLLDQINKSIPIKR